MEWQKYNGEKIDTTIWHAVEQSIVREKKAGNNIQIYVGTDSQVKRGVIELATVIVFLRPQSGGFMFIKKALQPHLMTIKERMLLEVQHSIDTAYQLAPLFDQYQIDLEIHADINSSPNFESHSAFKEAMGYIVGMGFRFKAKPDSFASTNCANKLVQ